MKRRYFFPFLAVAGRFARTAMAASDKITIALMGVRGRGRALTKAFCDQPDVNVAYVCDVDQSVVGPAFQLIEDSADGQVFPLQAWPDTYPDRACPYRIS